MNIKHEERRYKVKEKSVKIMFSEIIQLLHSKNTIQKINYLVLHFRSINKLDNGHSLKKISSVSPFRNLKPLVKLTAQINSLINYKMKNIQMKKQLEVIKNKFLKSCSMIVIQKIIIACLCLRIIKDKKLQIFVMKVSFKCHQIN